MGSQCRGRMPGTAIGPGGRVGFAPHRRHPRLFIVDFGEQAVRRRRTARAGEYPGAALGAPSLPGPREAQDRSIGEAHDEGLLAAAGNDTRLVEACHHESAPLTPLPGMARTVPATAPPKREHHRNLLCRQHAPARVEMPPRADHPPPPLDGGLPGSQVADAQAPCNARDASASRGQPARSQPITIPCPPERHAWVSGSLRAMRQSRCESIVRSIGSPPVVPAPAARTGVSGMRGYRACSAQRPSIAACLRRHRGGVRGAPREAKYIGPVEELHCRPRVCVPGVSRGLGM